MTTETRYSWVEAHLGRTLTEFQRQAVELLCAAMRCGPYDFARTFEKADWQHGKGVSFTVSRPQLATYDTDGLTALVLGAHDRSIRVQIDPGNFTHLRISMWPREPEHDSQWGRHPRLEQAVATWKGGVNDRDRAIEFAEYMAKAAERFMRRADGALCLSMNLEREVPDHLRDALSDGHQSLRSGIYEFRKRAQRVNRK